MEGDSRGAAAVVRLAGGWARSGCKAEESRADFLRGTSGRKFIMPGARVLVDGPNGLGDFGNQQRHGEVGIKVCRGRRWEEEGVLLMGPV